MLIYINPEKLRKVLTSVITSPYSSFYRDMCAKHGTLEHIRRLLEHPERMSDTDTSEILEQLPFLRRSDITASHPDTRLYIEPKEIEFISYTSGTSDGKPVILYWSHVDDYFFDPSLGFDVQKPLILESCR
jgi:phenylacetate-coenzyme A ligase PaaK-like adenylate-forming protein